MAKDAQQLIFRCADGVHVQITMGVPGAKDRLYAILGLKTVPAVSGDRAMPSLKKDPRNFFGEVDLLQERFGTFESAALLAQLAQADIPAEPLLAPGGCWDDPQVVHNGVLARDASGMQHVGLPFTLDPGAGGPMPLPSAAANALPLAGLRVLDLGTVIGGPYSSMVLHDLGAEVLRIESLTGDIIRPFARWFASVSRGKRAAAVDLKAPEAIALVHRLAQSVDVVHHNFRPGVAERLGIGPKQLHAINPKLVVLETFGYGASGPKALAPGFDMIFQAWCGHELRGGGAAHAPLWYRAAVVDFTAGALGATAVLAALLHPRGAGATVRTNLLNAGLFLMSELVRHADGTFAGAPAADDEQLGVRVAERLYRAADGWIALCVRGEPMARAFARMLGLEPVLAADPTAWGEPERVRIAAALATRQVSEWQSTLDAAGIWCEPCRTDAESDLYAGTGDALHYRLEAPHPHYGRTVQLGPLVTFPGRPQAPSGHIPSIGEHTATAMAEAGYAPEEIEDLRSRKIVR
jgi:crotonobetainyl-CoA:carnitine CoA-transferase CaiB-like acyl-CoA transferase